MRGKSSNQSESFLNTYLPIDNVQCENVRCPTVLNLNFFLSSNYSKLPQNATEIESFLKYVRNFFLKKKMSCLKKNLNFFKIGEGGGFVVECVSNDIISLKCLFST